MKECWRLRRAVSQNTPVAAELEQHLFACPACRRFVRSEQILNLLHESRQGPASVPPDFVERVMLGLAEEKERPKTASAGLKVMRWAAVLLFSMAAGYGFSVSTDVAKSVEWTASVTVVPSPTISTEIFGLPNDSSPS